MPKFQPFPVPSVGEKIAVSQGEPDLNRVFSRGKRRSWQRHLLPSEPDAPVPIRHGSNTGGVDPFGERLVSDTRSRRRSTRLAERGLRQDERR